MTMPGPPTPPAPSSARSTAPSQRVSSRANSAAVTAPPPSPTPCCGRSSRSAKANRGCRPLSCGTLPTSLHLGRDGRPARRQQPLGFVPLAFPTGRWDVLWLTPALALGSLWLGPAHRSRPRKRSARRFGAKPQGLEPMNAQELLQQIADYCRHSGLAESTFGRRAVNDGKLTARLRNGGRITTETFDRIRGFMENTRPASARPAVIERAREPRPATAPIPAAPAGQRDPQRNFRFFDNRQKYLLFVSTCSEKWVVASRVALELANVHPRPPALRVFDAGVGDGTVLLRVMRAMHDRFPTTPFYAVGKEISLEDVRLALQKMSDRFFEHPATVLVLTNLAYADAPWLAVKSLSAASSMVWHE